jgi:BirA family biotin operon repressor/biotin-[acetyl-CoA-carboxylase] ligase
MNFNRDRFLAAIAMIQQLPLAPSPPHPLISHSHPASCLLPFAFHLFDSLPSTNQTAWQLIAQDEILPVVIARLQTAGRGQRGRSWQSEAGGLYLSVGLEPTCAAECAPQLTIAVAWGIATALRSLPSRLSATETLIPVQIKWLNDLVLEGYKLGGILTETRVQGSTVTKAVVGVGINWCNPVPETGVNLQSFLERQPVPLIESLELLAAIVLHGLQSGYETWRTCGIDGILLDYLMLLAHRDRPIVYQDQDYNIVGVTPFGELQVQPLSGNNALKLAQVHSAIVIKPGTINLGYPISGNWLRELTCDRGRLNGGGGAE